MCGRYYIAQDDPDQELQAILAGLEKRGGEPVRLGEIFPSQLAPVIAANRGGRPAPFAMRWGFAWNGALLINARSETAASKPVFRESMERRRCLIPATRYFEWAKAGTERARYAFSTGALFYMAGVYRMEETGPAFAILTREAAPALAAIHSRMPVLLPPPAREVWLKEENPARALLLAVEELSFKVG